MQYEIMNPKDLGRMVTYLKKQDVVGFDIETVGLNPFVSKTVLWQFASRTKTFLVDMRDRDMQAYGEIIRPLFDGSVQITGMNIKFDLSFLLAQSGVQACNVYDVMIADLIIYGVGWSETIKTDFGMSLIDIAKRYGQEVHKEERNWFIDLDKRLEWDQPFPQSILDYGAQDVEVLFPIMDQQYVKIKKFNLFPTVQLDMRALPAVVNIENDGILIDREGWMKTIDKARAELAGLEEGLHIELDPHILAVRTEKFDADYEPWHIWELERAAYLDKITESYKHDGTGAVCDGVVGWGAIKKHLMAMWNTENPQPKKPKEDKSLPNISSSAQLKDALNHMDLGVTFETTKEPFLVTLVDRFPIIEKILAYKKADKLIAAFGDKLIEKLNPETGRLHASYQLIGAGTGRMSSYNPNFQQIPSKGAGAELRNSVIAPPGSKFVVSDFSNIELRIMADVSKDENLLAAFASKKDVHAMTASLMFNHPIPEGQDAKKYMDTHMAVVNGRTLEKSYRAVAKQINFMLIYGGGAAKLANMLGIETDEAKALMRTYFDTYRGVKAWLDKQHNIVDSRLHAIEVANRERNFNPQTKTVGRVVNSRTIGGRVRWYTLPSMPLIGRGASAENITQYKEAKDEYNKQLASIKRQAANSPIQGTSADITKLALALWHERINLDPEYPSVMRLVAVVHDELIVETYNGTTDMASKLLGEIMEEATRTYLHTVDIPKQVVVVSNHWEH